MKKTNKEIAIEILRAAEIAFKKRPDDSLNNEFGLCFFFDEYLYKHYKIFTEQAIYRIFSNKEFDTHSHPSIFMKMPQNRLYHKHKTKEPGYHNDVLYLRSNWCKNRIKQLEK